MSSLQGHTNVWVGAAATHPLPTAVSSRESAAQQGNTSASMRTSTRSYINRITASSATAVAGASPLQHFIGPVPQAYSSPAQYGEPTNLHGSTSPGATAPFQILGSPPQQPQQAEMHVYRDDSLAVPPSLAEVPHEDDNTEEKTLIFQLRGLPFAATRKDVESFLHTVDYDQLDVGTLATGESSGNAFVELHSLRAAEKLGRLHNTVITVAADAGVPVRERPRPRYVEVLAANAAKREQVLRLDARTSRSALPVPRRARAAAPASTTVTSVAGVFAEALPPQQPTRKMQPQAAAWQQHQQPPAVSAEGSARYFAASSATPPSPPSMLISPVSSQRLMDLPNYVGSPGFPSTSWGLYAQPQQHLQSGSLRSSSLMTMPHVIASQAVSMASSGAPAVLRLEYLEDSGVMRGATSAPWPLYQFVTPVAPQTQAPPPQRPLNTSNVSYYVVASVSSPSSTVTEARSTYYVAPLSSTQTTTAGSYYYLSGSA